MTMIVTSTLAARRFLGLVESEDPPLTQLKLMKLTYIAHGWHLGVFGVPLIDEAVLAWPHGPVFEDLYYATKNFKKFPVTQVAKSVREVFLDQTGRSKIEEEGLEIIKEVNTKYRKNTAWQLREMTHKSGTPWDKTRVKYGGIRGGPVIDNELIRQHYSCE